MWFENRDVLSLPFSVVSVRNPKVIVTVPKAAFQGHIPVERDYRIRIAKELGRECFHWVKRIHLLHSLPQIIGDCFQRCISNIVELLLRPKTTLNELLGIE